MDSSTLQGIERLAPGINLLDPSRPQKPVVIIGVGNLTQSDDSLGIRAAYELYGDISLKNEVDIFEAGNRVFDFLECLNGRKKAVILDAYEGNKEPGSIHRYVFNIEDFNSELEIPISFHDFNFVDAILSAKDTFDLPEEIVILGIEPLKLDRGIGLSPPVRKSLPRLIEMAKKEVKKCQ